MELHKIIRRPLVTEKTTLLREGNQYLFEVDPRANKIEIEKAVEKLFKVKVVDVRTLNVLGKKKRVGAAAGERRATGRRPSSPWPPAHDRDIRQSV